MPVVFVNARAKWNVLRLAASAISSRQISGDRFAWMYSIARRTERGREYPGGATCMPVITSACVSGSEWKSSIFIRQINLLWRSEQSTRPGPASGIPDPGPVPRRPGLCFLNFLLFDPVLAGDVGLRDAITRRPHDIAAKLPPDPAELASASGKSHHYGGPERIYSLRGSCRLRYSSVLGEQFVAVLEHVDGIVARR